MKLTNNKIYIFRMFCGQLLTFEIPACIMVSNLLKERTKAMKRKILALLLAGLMISASFVA